MTILNHMGNPAHGITQAPPGAWEGRAICATVDPELWHAAESAVNWSRLAEARHICLHHCPVLAECGRDIGPMRSAVVGGVIYNKTGQPAGYQPVTNRCRLCALWAAA